MRGLQAVHGVGGSQFAGLHDEGEQARREAQTEIEDPAAIGPSVKSSLWMVIQSGRRAFGCLGRRVGRSRRVQISFRSVRSLEAPRSHHRDARRLRLACCGNFHGLLPFLRNRTFGRRALLLVLRKAGRRTPTT